MGSILKVTYAIFNDGILLNGLRRADLPVHYRSFV